jgi:hypothetical protein
MIAKNPCAYCGRESIGIQIYGCCSVTVCADHADEELKSMAPGERRDRGACYLYRFPRTEPGNTSGASRLS